MGNVKLPCGVSLTLIGRDDEIRCTIQILSRRTKNKSVLIGEPVLVRLRSSSDSAQRIVVAGDVPQSLKDRVDRLLIWRTIAGCQVPKFMKSA